MSTKDKSFETQKEKMQDMAEERALRARMNALLEKLALAKNIEGVARELVIHQTIELSGDVLHKGIERYNMSNAARGGAGVGSGPATNVAGDSVGYGVMSE